MSTSPTFSRLEDLPLNVFEEICEQLMKYPGEAKKRSLFALGSTNKRLRSATAGLLFKTIRIQFESKSELPQEAERWKEILESRGCASCVRRLSIVEKVTLDEWDDEDVQKQWPPDREDDFFKRVNNDIWPLDKDDEFWTRPEAIEFDPWEPVPTPSQKAKEQTAWAPVVDFIASLAELGDVDFEGKSQIPTTVLRVLNEKDGGPVRLHIYGFSLRSLYQAESNYHDIDEDEFYLATSPCLSSIRLLVPNHPDRAHGVDDGNRVCFNEDAVARMIEGLAPNLKFVSFNETYSRRQARHDYIWPGFFPSRPQDTSKRGKGSLETIALESGISTDPDSMRAWNDRTSLNFLRSLHLRTGDIDVPTLAVLSEIAEAQGLCSLRSLSLWIGGWPSEENEDRITEYRDTEISRFLTALRPLQSLELKGPFADKTFDTILHTHGRSLRKLRLIPERDLDVQMEPFVLTRDRVEALVRSCNHIQDLELRIPRSQGDEDEVRIYHALSELPLLDRLSLLLDCSNLQAAEEESDNTSGIADSFICKALINLNTSDRTLALDIFDALSLRNSPRLIRLYPDEVGNFGTDVREWSMIFIRNVLSRAWIRERDDMLSHEGGFRITEIEAKNRQNSDREPILSEFDRALVAAWPKSDSWFGDKGKFRSFPLWKPGNL